ncbi:MAG: ABC transporter permease [Porticoccaceae bacterium]
MNYFRKASWVPSAAGLVLALVITVILFSILLTEAGRNAPETFVALFKGAFGSMYSIRETLTRCTPLMLCALAVAVPARAGLFNIGGEGQLQIGAVAATVVALNAGVHATSFVTISSMVLAACLAGAAWAFIPAILKAFWNVNEVLVALMLNYVGILLVDHLVHGPWKDVSALGWPYSASFPAVAILPRWGDSNVHLGLGIALISAVFFWFVITRTTFGFSVKVIEASPAAARTVGIRIRTWILVTMAIGGALAAMSGMGEVSVIQGRLRPDLSSGYGYIGFLVSWLAGHRFLAIIPVAIVVGGLYSGSDALQLSAGLPSSTVDIMLGLVFTGALLSTPLRQWLERWQISGVSE